MCVEAFGSCVCVQIRGLDNAMASWACSPELKAIGGRRKRLVAIKVAFCSLTVSLKHLAAWWQGCPRGFLCTVPSSESTGGPGRGDVCAHSWLGTHWFPGLQPAVLPPSSRWQQSQQPSYLDVGEMRRRQRQLEVALKTTSSKQHWRAAFHHLGLEEAWAQEGWQGAKVRVEGRGQGQGRPVPDDEGSCLGRLEGVNF